MVTMSLTGAGLLTFYCVMTALLTVRSAPRPPWIDPAGALFALTVSALPFVAAFELSSNGRPETAPCLMFGVVGLLGAAGDIRMVRAGGLEGHRRIARPRCNLKGDSK